MLRYYPSIKNNNELEQNFSKLLRTTIYKAEKGRTHIHLPASELKPILLSLNESLESLDNCLSTGQENVHDIYLNALIDLKNFEKALNQELISPVEEASDQLLYTMDYWKDILNGKVEFSEEELSSSKTIWTKKKLLKRLEELEELKEQFVQHEKRLEKEIVSLEKEKNELDAGIVNENNERRINDLYRRINAVNSKKDTLNIRRSNYNACYNLLDIIYINAKEIVTASDYSKVDLSKAKAFLNLNKLKQVLNNPEKAITIIKRMENDISKIANQTKAIDEKVLGLEKNTITPNEEALAYKERLMRKSIETNEINSVDDLLEKDRITMKGNN